MIVRDDLVRYLDTFFDIPNCSDVSWNGLQFEGRSEVKRIAFAVDAGCETFRKAAEAGADMLIVHHGLFWGKGDPRITGVHRKRLAHLWENDLSLYAVHLPLDAHDILGNNSGLLALAGAEQTGRFCDCGKLLLGALGRFVQPVSLQEVAQRIGKSLSVEPKLVAVSDRPVTTVAAMSGACGRDDLIDAAKRGVELLITGEQSEFYHDAHDFGISVLFAGHHASETVGVSLLKKHIEKTFPTVETIWIECPTGL